MNIFPKVDYMNKFLLVICFLILLGCSNDIKLQDAHKISPKQKIVNQIRSRSAKFIEKEKGLKPCGTGAQMMYEVKMLALAFVYNKPIDIDQGREFLVYAAETFIDIINEDERIRPYLYNYPFKPKNVEIRIFINNPDNSLVDAGKLCIISLIDNYCAYKIWDIQTGRLKTILKETFEEAKEKIKLRQSI